MFELIAGNQMGKLWLVIFVLISPSTVAAGADFFYCEVTSVIGLSTDGSGIIQDKQYLKDQIGIKFSVQRSNGEIRGSEWINNQYRDDIKVTNPSLDEDYYVVSGHLEPKIFFDPTFLAIKNRYSGQRKPFIFVGSSHVTYYCFCI